MNLPPQSAEEARQLIEDNGLENALLIATNKIGALQDAAAMFGMNNEIADNLGYWQEVKQAIEFKIKEDGEN